MRKIQDKKLEIHWPYLFTGGVQTKQSKSIHLSKYLILKKKL